MKRFLGQFWLLDLFPIWQIALKFVKISELKSVGTGLSDLVLTFCSVYSRKLCTATLDRQSKEDGDLLTSLKFSHRQLGSIAVSLQTAFIGVK